LINGVLHVYVEVPEPHLIVYPMQNLVDVCGYDVNNFAVANDSGRIYWRRELNRYIHQSTNNWSTNNPSKTILNMLCDQRYLYVQTSTGVYRNGSTESFTDRHATLLLLWGKVQAGNWVLDKLPVPKGELSKHEIHTEGARISFGLTRESGFAMDKRGCLWFKKGENMVPVETSQKFKSISIGKNDALAIDTDNNVHTIRSDGKISILNLSNLPRVKGDISLPSVPEKVSKTLIKGVLAHRQYDKDLKQRQNQKLDLFKIKNISAKNCEMFNMVIPARKVVFALANQMPELNREPDESVCLLYQKQKPDNAWFLKQERHIEDLTAKDETYSEIAKHYTKHGDVVLNNYLRGNEKIALKALKKYRTRLLRYPFMTMFKRYAEVDDKEILDMVADKLNTLILTAPPVKKTVRVIRIEDTKHYKSLMEGDVMVTNSFMSCSLMYGAFSGHEGDSVLSLEIPTGTRMLYLGTVSEFPGELEVLLPVGTRIKITEVTHQWYFSFGGGNPVRARTIHGKVVGQNLIDD